MPKWIREQLQWEQDQQLARHTSPYLAHWYGWSVNPWDQVDLRDDRLVLLASRLPEGVYEYVYYARATTPGNFFLAPAHAEEAYFPEVFGRSDSGRFAVAETGEASTGAVSGVVYANGGDVSLPDGAVVTVKLLDVSLADGPSTTLGEHVIDDAARLPVEFRIPYDPEVIDERYNYSLQATVRLDGRLLYINDTVHSVLTFGNPAHGDIEVIRIR